jgi:heme/copper-type cytochrome/quinol oxidase subunit 4
MSGSDFDYLDISNVITDSIFGTPNDSQYNPNQYKFYTQVNSSLNGLTTPLNEDLRQLQINTYYYKRYKSENNLLNFIMVVFIIIIIIALIKKQTPFFDDLSYSIIVGTILGIALLYIVYSIYLLMHKDDYNYDEDDYADYMFNTDIDICNNHINSECLQK